MTHEANALSAVQRGCLTLGALVALSQCPSVLAMGAEPMNATTPIDDRTVELVLQGSDWRADQTCVAQDLLATSLSASCRFYSAHNTVIPGAGVMRFVLDDQGALRARTGDMAGLTYVLRTCLPTDADASAWADVIAGFISARPPRVVRADDKLAQASLPAGQYRPPIKQTVGGETRVDFFATGHDLRQLQINAVLPATGPVRIEMQPVGR